MKLLSKDILVKTVVSTEDIDALNQEIAGLLDMYEVPRSLAIMSLISMACTVMNPDQSPDQLKDATVDCVQYISTRVAPVATLDTGELDPSQVN